MATTTDDEYPVGTEYPPPTVSSVNSINDDVLVSPPHTTASPPVIYHVDKDDSCTKSCRYGIYSFFGTLFCFKKNQSLMSKLGITWLWTFFIPLAIGLVLGLYVFAPYSFMSSPGDQRSLMGRYDGFFCDAIRVDSDERFDAYLLSHSPSILQDNRSYTNVKLPNISIPLNSYKEWNFYFLEGSVVKFEVCNTMKLEFFFLKGEDNFNKWKKNPNSCDCSIQHISYPNSSTKCVKPTASNNFTASVGSTDEYYLVFQNPSNKDPIEMSLNVQVNRSTYNVYDNVKNSCRNNYTCDLSLGFLSSESFVYVSLENNSFSVKNKVYCDPTWGVYLIMFGAIPMITGFVISLVLFILFMHCNGAWEGVYRPRPWDEGKTQQNSPSILDTLPDGGKKLKDEKKNQRGKKKNGTLFGKNSGYDTLTEEESQEESLDTLPRNSPPPSYESMLGPAGEGPDAAPTGTNDVATVEVHAISE